MDSLAGTQHISVSMATKCPAQIFGATKELKSSRTKSKTHFLVNKSSDLFYSLDSLSNPSPAGTSSWCYMFEQDLIDALCLLHAQNVHINTQMFPQIGWAVPQCLWPISHPWPPMKSFNRGQDFLRCMQASAEQATDIMSSMRCSPFLSAWPTSAPEIAALRSLLPILFCYFTAPATTLKTGGGKMGDRGARDEGAPGSHKLSRDCSVAQLSFCQQRVVLCEDSHYDGEPCISFF